MPEMTKAPRHLRIFLCHSSGDKQAVRELYRRLHADGFDPWLDEENLLPGQDWQRVITEAVRAADIVLVCLSRDSVNKRGYVQKEIKYALDVADEQPDDAIYLIPLRLEDCDIPERLRRWHWVSLFEPTGYERLLSSLKYRATLLAGDPNIDDLLHPTTRRGVQEDPYSIIRQSLREMYDRIPEVLSSVATVLAAEKLVEKNKSRLDTQITDLETKIGQARRIRRENIASQYVNLLEEAKADLTDTITQLEEAKRRTQQAVNAKDNYLATLRKRKDEAAKLISTFSKTQAVEFHDEFNGLEELLISRWAKDIDDNGLEGFPLSGE
jgi:hypothetical protein